MTANLIIAGDLSGFYVIEQSFQEWQIKYSGYSMIKMLEISMVALKSASSTHLLLDHMNTNIF